MEDTLVAVREIAYASTRSNFNENPSFTVFFSFFFGKSLQLFRYYLEIRDASCTLQSAPKPAIRPFGTPGNANCGASRSNL